MALSNEKSRFALLYRGETRERVAWHRFQVGQTDHGPSNEKSRFVLLYRGETRNALRHRFQVGQTRVSQNFDRI
jgi:hypothetical protein